MISLLDIISGKMLRNRSQQPEVDLRIILFPL